MASETEREAHHQRIRLNRATETPDHIEARRQQDAEYHRRQREINPAVPLFHQPGVCSKMKTFHMRLAALEVCKCITCLERFPGLTVRVISSISNDAECLRCRQYKRTPELYSSANNMNLGPVPSELLVAMSLMATTDCMTRSGSPHRCPASH